jgi:hypothetical protein
MTGVLTRMRSSGLRRRFDRGGAATDDDYLDPLPGALTNADAPIVPAVPAPEGAVRRAPAPVTPAQRQVAQSQAAMRILAAGGNPVEAEPGMMVGARLAPDQPPQLGDPDFAGSPGWIQRLLGPQPVNNQGALQSGQQDGVNVNLPLLAAAGALLTPTRTGGFAESLGNAFTSGAGALSQQRQMEEQARLREAQQAATAAYRQDVLAINQQRANTQADTGAARVAQLQAQAALLSAKAALGANSKFTDADMFDKAANKMVESGKINPATNEPYTYFEALPFVRQTAAQMQSADARGVRQVSGQGPGPDGSPTDGVWTVYPDTRDPVFRPGVVPQTTLQGNARTANQQAALDLKREQFTQTMQYRQAEAAAKRAGADAAKFRSFFNSASRNAFTPVQLQAAADMAAKLAAQQGASPQQSLIPRAPAATPPSTPAIPAPPRVDEIRQGYRYNGGPPADPNSWTREQ